MMSSIRFLWILMVSLTTSCALSQSHKLSAYDVLMEYRFPVGLLPKGAIGYSLNRDNSEFTAYFQEALYNLKGVTVKILLLWLNIIEVSRQGNNIYFSIRITSAYFGVENFLESP
ncbi:hypothetical protein glysoja_024103 [Glycine soja]|uniref:Uncharacterized protein n=1 Tax=Glycine soja TaxID=3848 RepID=A0A0B2RKB9_GLYSO|nr:hypothetical protein glysoja_024103 [Glycine soja]